MRHYLAIDLGAESGRAMLGTLDSGRLQMEELHRFLNQPVSLPEGLYWDSFRLFHDICEGLRVAGRERKLHLDGIAVDTWGVDYGLLGANGALVENPRCYRDPRTNGMFEKTFAVISKSEIFAETGLQFMELNTLYQLHAAKLAQAPGLQVATRLLFMPELLSYWLCGTAKNELTIASTSQFYNPATKSWSKKILHALGLPEGILGEIVPPGALLGYLRDDLQDRAGLGRTPVYATAGHDTAAAVAAVPAQGQDWCYISSGTWSLMGIELMQPLINDEVARLNFTNEVGVEGRIRLLKNIAGLWLVQECRRAWQLEGTDYAYADLAARAEASGPAAGWVNPDAFITPGHMPQRIAEYCAKTGQPAPEGPGAMVRCILESLALRYRQVLEGLETLVGRPLPVIHIVGGGSQNRVLNQLVADATGKTVVAGPAEATAIGNVLVQAMGGKAIASLDELRRVVAESFALESFAPRRDSHWDRAALKFAAITSATAK